jgi:hypothetical protein
MLNIFLKGTYNKEASSEKRDNPITKAQPINYGNVEIYKVLFYMVYALQT